MPDEVHTVAFPTFFLLFLYSCLELGISVGRWVCDVDTCLISSGFGYNLVSCIILEWLVGCHYTSQCN
jgi:hypothetical protein